MDLTATRSLLIIQAAAVLGVSRRTIYNRIRSGELETVRTYGGSQRVLLASVQRAIERQTLRDLGVGSASGAS